jgi:hypothetical protein
MTNTVLIKRSGTANAIPGSGNLSLGELAVNYTDGNLFYKDNLGTVKVIASNQFTSVTGNVTGGNILTAGLISATGNITGGNILTAGLISAAGNITGGNINLPSGTTLNSAGVFVASSAVTTQTVQVSANTLGSGVAITTDGITGGVLSSGNIYFKVNSTLNANAAPSGGTVQAEIGSNGMNLTGNLDLSGNVNANNIFSTNAIQATVISATGNVSGGNVNSSGNAMVGNLLSAALVRGTTLSAAGNITGGNVVTTGLITATGNITGNYILGNGSQLTGISVNAFSTISVLGQSNVVANSTGVLTFVEGSGVTIETDNTTGAVTFTAINSPSIFDTGGDMGLISEAVTSAQDLGLIIDVAGTSYDLGTLVQEGLIWPSQFKLPEFTVGTLPTATPAGLMIYVSDASGGSIPAFSDGSNWRRVDTRNIVT